MKVATKVILAASATCPKCNRKLVETADLDEEALTTGNTTQRASYWMASLKSLVQARATQRGWTGESCGRCRDQDHLDVDRTANAQPRGGAETKGSGR
jgi:hypothetical protein